MTTQNIFFTVREVIKLLHTTFLRNVRKKKPNFTMLRVNVGPKSNQITIPKYSLVELVSDFTYRRT